jgi:hypothetical protein
MRSALAIAVSMTIKGGQDTTFKPPIECHPLQTRNSEATWSANGFELAVERDLWQFAADMWALLDKSRSRIR